MSIIAPSLLACDKTKMQEEIALVESLGVEWLHWDIMDGKFVPNTSFSLEDFKKYAKSHHLKNDVHIMVENPKEIAPLFMEAGADLVTFHIEAVSCPICVGKIVEKLHSNNCKVGISIKPKTNIKTIIPFLDKIDLVLVMSVEPGKGGQTFINSSLRKIKKLRKIIDKNHYNCLVEVDGGINDVTGAKCRKAGADVLVAGTYLFSHDDIKERIELLR